MLRFASVVAVSLSMACTGAVGVGTADDTSGSGDDSNGGAGRAGSGGGALGGAPSAPRGPCEATTQKAPLRRLNRTEYNNTIRDLLFIKTSVADAFEADTSVAGFATNGIATLSASGAQDYAEAAASLAAQVDLAKILPCDANAGTDACARTFITDFGRRAFRRPLGAGEVDAVFAVFANKKSRSNFAAAARLVVEILLQAPSFLYRPEVAGTDDAPAAKVARGYEMASRLSYFLWGTMPDEPLFKAAQSGALLDKKLRESEVRRMVADPRTSAAIRSFYDQWTGGPRLATADKDNKRFPTFDDDLKASMREETGRFVQEVYEKEGGSLAALLTADWGMVDARLAKLYGVAASGSGFARVKLPPGQRSGLLTHAGVMAGHAFAAEPSPIHRGLFVRRKLLCQELTLPPNVEITPPVVNPDVSIRDRLAQHREEPACKSCHQLMDPIGFGFGHYDAIGAWQTMEGKFPVDAKGELAETGDIDGAFEGAIELGERLAGSETVHRCMAKQWFAFAVGRSEAEGDECVIDELASRLVASGLDLRELAVAIATSDAFALSQTN